MNISFDRKRFVVTLLGSFALLAGGCAMPQINADPTVFAKPQADTVPAAPAEKVSQVSSQPSPAAAPFGSVPPRPAAAPDNTANGSVAQVGHFIPARLQGTCACGGCGRQSCAQDCTPHGYVMCSPQGWNAYGIDPQEFLCDGGDRHPRAVLRHDDSVAGLGLEDTVVHYTTGAGDIEFQASNRTCIYAPRFTSVRHITAAAAGGRATGLSGMDRPIGPIRVEHDLPRLVMTETTELGHADVARRIDAMRERNRGVPVERVQQIEQASDVMAALAALSLYDLGQTSDSQLAVVQRLALAAVPWTMDKSLEVAIQDLKAPTLTRDQRLEAFTIYEFPDAGRLRIVKLADRSDALPGELVEFAIRIENVGDSAVDHVVLTDNLTTRLEYVPDSQKSDGAQTEFTTTQNEGQSLKLQWKLVEELKVGESVTIRFQCKVR